MTIPTFNPRADSADGPATVASAEAAWLAAIAGTEDAQRQLMLPDCVVVHGPVGYVHDRETFLRYNSTMGAIIAAETGEVDVREFDGQAIVTCYQKLRVEFVPDLAPFLIQAAVTRIWTWTDEGWRLRHMQLSRRQPAP
jgi:hypothetical protein